jgi:DNA mismatch endonuclease (patch repair protein)
MKPQPPRFLIVAFYSKMNYSKRNFKKQRQSDKLTIEKRSSLMSKIKSKNTKLESVFIGALKREGIKGFKLNVKEIKGKPDIVFEKEKICIFLDSDFWHGWQYPRWKHLLKNDFWREKIERNRKRDKKVKEYLRRSGWTVIRIWEHNIVYKRQLN